MREMSVWASVQPYRTSGSSLRRGGPGGFRAAAAVGREAVFRGTCAKGAAGPSFVGGGGGVRILRSRWCLPETRELQNAGIFLVSAGGRVLIALHASSSHGV